MSVEDAIVTVVGNITADPELTYSDQGVAVARFTVASSRRVYDKASGSWSDGDTLFMRCSAFRQLAENCTESLGKGTRVMVTGRLTQRSYEDKEGITRTVFGLQADEVGPSLKWATAKAVGARRDRAPSAGGSFSPEPPF